MPATSSGSWGDDNGMEAEKVMKKERRKRSGRAGWRMGERNIVSYFGGEG